MFALTFDAEQELRILEECHAEELFALTDKNRTHLKKWLPWLDLTKSAVDTRNFIGIALEGFAKGKSLVAGIWVNGKIVGTISFNTIDRTNRKASIGYWLDESHQRRGIVTKACRALVDYGFQELKLNRVEISCAVGNHGSQAIPKRLGLKEEGNSRQAEWLYDHFVDHVNYAVLASEWKTQ